MPDNDPTLEELKARALAEITAQRDELLSIVKDYIAGWPDQCLYKRAVAAIERFDTQNRGGL